MWRESLEAMHGSRWVTGYGFNAYADALSRVPAWALPRGATPWPEAVAVPLASGQRLSDPRLCRQRGLYLAVGTRKPVAHFVQVFKHHRHFPGRAVLGLDGGQLVVQFHRPHCPPQLCQGSGHPAGSGLSK